MAFERIHFVASSADLAQASLEQLVATHGQWPVEAADVIVALGGDGLMLQTLHATEGMAIPVYGMNRGTVGFLMNEYAEGGLLDRLQAAEEAHTDPGLLHEAPVSTPVRRLDEARAARHLRLRWGLEEEPDRRP